MHCDRSSFQEVPSLASGSFCTHMSWSVLIWLRSGNSLHIPRVLWDALSSLMPTYEFQLPRFLWRFSSASSVHGVCQALSVVPDLCCVLGTLSGQYTGAIAGLLLFVFRLSEITLSLTAWCSVFWKLPYSIHFFGLFGWESKSSYYSILARCVNSMLQNFEFMPQAMQKHH